MKDRLGSDDYRDPNRFDYHYDRDERLNQLPPEVRAKMSAPAGKGIFRKNRGLTVILLDIGIIALVWFVFLPLIHAGASGSIEGYSFSLHGFSYNGKALISLKVRKDAETKGLLPSYTAIFGISSGNKTVEMQGVLPKRLHASSTLRTSLPLEGKTVAILCTVRLGGKKLTLKAKLQRES